MKYLNKLIMKWNHLQAPAWFSVFLVCVLTGCQSANDWRTDADMKAGKRLENAQVEVLGHAETIAVESAQDTFRRRLMLDQNLPHLDKASLGIRDLDDTEKWSKERHLLAGRPYDSAFNTQETVKLSLDDAIMIGARNSREYQSQKEQLFQVALRLDLEDHSFQNTFTGMLKSTFESSHDGKTRNSGFANKASAGISRTFKNGVEMAAGIAVDLAKLVTGDKGSSWGVTADASISIPLLRGSGEFVVAEPLKQAERNLLYQVREFEQYKRRFVVSVATSYLGVLQAEQRIRNQEENYKRVITSTRRSRRMADAGKLPENQFDQAVQDELAARDNWIAARQNYQTSLDAFKILIGLPPDANVVPVQDELVKLQKNGENLGGKGNVTDYAEGQTPAADTPIDLREPDNSNAGPYEIDEAKAIQLALHNRPDLKNSLDKIQDAQRAVVIAEDALRAELTLGGRVSAGEGRSLAQANRDNGDFLLNRASYSAPLTFDFGWERTRERNNYRNSLIALEKAVRDFQNEEDQLKQSIRSTLRNLLEKRSSVVIQRQAVKLAERRVDSTSLLLQAGRAEMRDVLEAQNALLSAQNQMVSALVSYRLKELELQRDLGLLNVTADGVWKETDLSEYK